MLDRTGTRPQGGHDLHPHHGLHRRAGDRDHHPHSARVDQGVRRRQHTAGRPLVRRPGLHLRAHAVHLRAGAGCAVGPRGPQARDPDLAVRARCRLHHHGIRAVAGLAVRGTPDCRRDGGEHHHGERLHRRCVEAGGPGAQFRADRRGLWPGLHLRSGPRRDPRRHRSAASLLRLGGTCAGELALRLFRSARVTAAGKAGCVQLEEGEPGRQPLRARLLSPGRRPHGRVRLRRAGATRPRDGLGPLHRPQVRLGRADERLLAHAGRADGGDRAGGAGAPDCGQAR